MPAMMENIAEQGAQRRLDRFPIDVISVNDEPRIDDSIDNGLRPHV